MYLFVTNIIPVSKNMYSKFTNSQKFHKSADKANQIFNIFFFSSKKFIAKKIFQKRASTLILIHVTGYSPL